MGSSESTANSASMSSQDMQGQGAESQQLFLCPDALLNIRERKTPRYNRLSARWDARRTGWTARYLMIPPPKKNTARTSLLLSRRANRAAEARHCPTPSETRRWLVHTCVGDFKNGSKRRDLRCLLKTCGKGTVRSSWRAGAVAASLGWLRPQTDGNQCGGCVHNNLIIAGNNIMEVVCFNH